MFKTVVVGTDGSDTATKAVRQAIDLVKMSGGTLHLVSAYRPKQLQLRSEGEEFAKCLDSGDIAESLLADSASTAKTAGVATEVHAEMGSPADVLCRVAEEIGADLVIVGNKGMVGAGRVLGSVPNSVAHRAPTSVLIIQTT